MFCVMCGFDQTQHLLFTNCYQLPDICIFTLKLMSPAVLTYASLVDFSSAKHYDIYQAVLTAVVNCSYSA